MYALEICNLTKYININSTVFYIWLSLKNVDEREMYIN